MAAAIVADERRRPITPLTLAKKAARIAEDRKAEDVVLLDVRKISGVVDFFVICSSNSAIGVRTIAEEIAVGLKKEDVRAHHVEGTRESNWVLIDYGDVIVNVFLENIRKYFDLESLWGDAPRKNFRTKAAASETKRTRKKK